MTKKACDVIVPSNYRTLVSDIDSILLSRTTIVSASQDELVIDTHLRVLSCDILMPIHEAGEKYGLKEMNIAVANNQLRLILDFGE